MQRFVQGEVKIYRRKAGFRTLDSKRGLAELQNIKFNVEIDGDLFKAILKWE